MSKLDELIQQYCPDGVDFRPLGEVCHSIRTGKLNANEKDEDGAFPFFTCDAEPYRINTYAFDCEAILVTGNGSQVGHINYYNGKFNAYQRTYVLSSFDKSVSIFFALHYFRGYLKEYILVNSKKGSVPYITLPMLQNFLVPVPPLPVQEEIVRILDTFTELQTELQEKLKAELKARKKQYEYYRDTLLSFEGREDVQWMKLGDVASQWYRGAGIKRDEVSEEGTPCIRYGEIHTTYNIWFNECVSHTDENRQPAKKYAAYGDILFAITSEDIPFIGNSVAYLGKERIMVGGDIVVMKHNQDPKYMSYVLSTSDAVKQKGKGKVKSKVVHTSVPSLQEIVVPIPSLDEQEKIATILDRFNHLTTDITAGLPAEIEARRKQYEYYRDQLLTFKQKA